MHVHLQGVLFEPANSEATQNIERNIEQDAEIDPSVPRATIVTTIKHADPKGFVPSSIMGLGQSLRTLTLFDVLEGISLKKLFVCVYLELSS